MRQEWLQERFLGVCPCVPRVGSGLTLTHGGIAEQIVTVIIWDNAVMRTTKNLDEKLILKVMQRTGARTKSKAVDMALNALIDGPPAQTAITTISKPDYCAILAMFGSGALDPAYDPKASFGKRSAQVQ